VKKFLIFLLLFFSSLAAEPIHSASNEEETKETFLSAVTSGEGHHYWKDFINMLITLVIILAFIFATVWFLKRAMRSRLHQLNRTTGIKILERRALSAKSSLYLISVLGKGVVISDSPAGIQLVTEFSEEKDVELLLNEKQESVTRPSFSSMMQTKMKQLLKRNAT